MYDRFPQEVRDLLKGFVSLDERHKTFFHWNKDRINTPTSSALTKWNGCFNVEYLDDDCSSHSEGRILDIDTALRHAFNVFEGKDIRTIYVSIQHSFYQFNSMLNNITETTTNHHLVAMIDVPQIEDDIV